MNSMLQQVVKDAIRVKQKLLEARNCLLKDTPATAEARTKTKTKRKRQADDDEDEEDEAIVLNMNYDELRFPEFAQYYDWVYSANCGMTVADIWQLPDYKPLHVAREKLQMSVTAYFNNDGKGLQQALQRSGVPKKPLTKRLKGKDGRLRGNLMGKRVNFSARTVITPDPNVDVDELGVPEAIALRETIPETVTHFNYHVLAERVRRGTKSVHGAKRIKTQDGRTIQLCYFDGKPPPKLEIGMVVERYLQPGDRVIFNRQPSLHQQSMMSHRVRIMKEGRTFCLNVAATAPYNADRLIFFIAF